MKRSNTRKASVIGLLLVVMVFSTVYGIMSARRQNWAYRIYLQLYWKKQRLLSEEDKARATPGIWLPARNQTLVISEERQKAVDNLTALPYLKGYNQAPEVQNVTVHNEELAYRGINFVLSSNAPNAFFMDMQGNILHKWQKDFKEVWPELENAGESKFAQYWKRARMLKNGDLLAIFTDLGLIKLDKNSNLLWAFQKRCHHDMFENDDGNIYVLTRSVKKQPELQLESYDTERPLMLYYVTILSPEGKEIRSISLLDCFLNSDFAPMLEHMKCLSMSCTRTPSGQSMANWKLHTRCSRRGIF